ncbi:MAG TPA: hypothetical protein VGA04_19395 [Streptosporangiaceae bacterium]
MLMIAASPQADLSSFAELLFVSPVQRSEHASPAEIREAVDVQFRACQGNPKVCLELIAQEAGDHPDLCAARMRWAKRCVALAYPG